MQAPADPRIDTGGIWMMDDAMADHMKFDDGSPVDVVSWRYIGELRSKATALGEEHLTTAEVAGGDLGKILVLQAADEIRVRCTRL